MVLPLLFREATQWSLRLLFQNHFCIIRDPARITFWIFFILLIYCEHYWWFWCKSLLFTNYVKIYSLPGRMLLDPGKTVTDFRAVCHRLWTVLHRNSIGWMYPNCAVLSYHRTLRPVNLCPDLCLGGLQGRVACVI